MRSFPRDPPDPAAPPASHALPRSRFRVPAPDRSSLPAHPSRSTPMGYSLHPSAGDALAPADDTRSRLEILIARTAAAQAALADALTVQERAELALAEAMIDGDHGRLAALEEAARRAETAVRRARVVVDALATRRAEAEVLDRRDAADRALARLHELSAQTVAREGRINQLARELAELLAAESRDNTAWDDAARAVWRDSREVPAITRPGERRTKEPTGFGVAVPILAMKVWTTDGQLLWPPR